MIGAAGPCLEAAQLIDFYSGLLAKQENVAVREHLTSCPKCREEARESRVFLDVRAEPSETRPAVRVAFLSRHVLLAAAMLVITTGAALLIWRARRTEVPPETQALSTTPSTIVPPAAAQNPWRDLVIAKADYAPPTAGPGELYWRIGGKGAQTQSTLPRAMMPYETNDFAGAERLLAEFLKDHPDAADAHFYRGVSLLMLGRTPEAVPPLLAAVDNGTGKIRDEARWYLALALLKDGRHATAFEELDLLASAPGDRRGDAVKLRQDVRMRAPKQH